MEQLFKVREKTALNRVQDPLILKAPVNVPQTSSEPPLQQYY
jgi:hypothetical protein